MSDFKKYFEEELRQLTDEGSEFARAFPEIASYLNLSSVDDRDPYVERLFEGFAYLTGRIRQKLDDDFPEITENIMEMIAPDFLRPIPSLSMVQFIPRKGMLQKSTTLKRETVVLSNPAGKSLTVCRFQTTQEITVHPITLSKVNVISHPSKGNGLKFDFSVEEGADLSQLAEDRISMYIHGDRSLVWEMHYLLTKNIREISYEFINEQPKVFIGPHPIIIPGGFGSNQNLLPKQVNGLECGRFLKEFFVFDEKFRFINLPKFSFLTNKADAGNFSLIIFFNQALDPRLKISVDNFKLYVSPVINLFDHQSEPVKLDHRHFEYRVIPSLSDNYDVFKVNSVIGVDKVSGRKQKYSPFNEFRHVINNAEKTPGKYFSIRREFAQGKESKVYISPGNSGKAEDYREEYLSISLTSTNNIIPRKEIFEKDICSPVAGFPEVIHFFNITRPTAPMNPPSRQHYLWTVLSHLNMNFKTLAHKEVFCEVLQLYDWKTSGANQRIINGIIGIESGKKSHMLDGQLVHGTDITIKFKDGTFGGQGEKNIFGDVLLFFLTNYTSINYVVSLNFISEPSGEQISWPPLSGNGNSI